MASEQKQVKVEVPAEVMAIVTALFLEFDKDQNGFLDRQELAIGLHRLGFRLNEEQQEAVFRKVDGLKSDGKISLQEFLLLFVNLENKDEKEAEKAQLRRIFQEFDEDGDNMLTKEELEKGLKKIGMDAQKRSEVTKCITNHDRNGDGKLDFEEFVELLTSN